MADKTREITGAMSASHPEDWDEIQNSTRDRALYGSEVRARPDTTEAPK